MPRMAFSAEREYDDDGPPREDDVDLEGILEDLRQGQCTREEREEEREEHRMNLLGDYITALTNTHPQHVNQEFRTALTVEAVRTFEKLRSTWGEHVWEEVTHQLLRAWEDVQVYCYDHHCACPDLTRLFQEGSRIPTELAQRSLLYTQTYLQSAGWRGAGEERETAEEREAHHDVRELLAPSLVTFVESIIVLPKSLREFLTDWVQRDGRLPQREELLLQIKQHGVDDAAEHVAWLEDRHTEAKHLLILSNMRFAVYKAQQYRGKGIPVADLIQESVIGVMDAADKFEPYRGAIFMNFAVDWVLKAIRTEFAERCRLIYRSHNVGTEISTLEKCKSALQETLGREPFPAEVRETLSWSVEVFERVQQARTQGIISLDTIVRVNEEGRIVEKPVRETLVDPESTGDAFEQGYHIVRCDLLTEALKSLNERDRMIIIRRRGLDRNPPYTLQQVANILKIVRERVRQLESRGEARLMRIIARRFPHLLPEGMTPERAIALADERDGGQASRDQGERGEAFKKRKKARILAMRQRAKGNIDALAIRGGKDVS